MEREEILKSLNVIFQEVLKNTGLQLDETMSANDVDGWDSLSNMTIVSEVERRWNFRFKLHDIVKMRNIGDMIDCIIKRSK
ncbi:MAG: acyl carrier protein [Prevotella sp.]|nr:acyl carrier protein [Prevotella sp.]